MDPRTQFCHRPDCPARGQVGQGNIRVHSRKERRYRCPLCGKTFAETKGTPFYRLETSETWVTLVVTLLCHGCPMQAIVAAFGFDKRSVTNWWLRLGKHCEGVHQHLVQQGKVDLKHIQADELWVKVVARSLWMAMAIAVPSRLWLAGLISEHRDKTLITQLVEKVRACAQRLELLVCVDGLQSYVKAFLKVFRNPVYTGRRGRPKLVFAQGLLMGQVIKQYAKRHVVGVGSRDPPRHSSGIASDGHRQRHQHLLYRTIECHLSPSSGSSCSMGTNDCPQALDAASGDVGGGIGL
jgi:transposase-like protein